MRQKMILTFVLLACVFLLIPLVSTFAQENTMPEHKIIGYFISWGIYDRQYFVTSVPAEKLTHINYAFANVSENGECILGDEWADAQFPYPGDADDQPLKGNFHQFQRLKEQYPHLKTLISVGGWTWSDRFSDAALTAESRAKFAASCVALVKQYGFDGLDVDWEYPTGGGLNPEAGRPEDIENFTLLLAELRRQFDAQGEQDGVHYLLTIAAPAGPANYQKIQLDQIHQHLDWINVMTYDFHGPWASTTNFHAALYAPGDDPDPANAALNTDAALQAYLAAGIPPEKLVMGVPFYGYGWSGVATTNNGLFQPASRATVGTWEPGSFDYGDLAANYIPAYTRFWHDTAQVPWLYNAEQQIMITYNDPEAMRLKAEYIKAHGLGGVMFWELSQDSRDSALLDALYTTLHAE